jgi:hypothetical protein
MLVQQENMKMAHRHRAPDHSHVEGKKSGNSMVHSTAPTAPDLPPSSRTAEEVRENAPLHERRKSVFDYQIAGFSWPFVVIMSLIALAVMGMILKVTGVF